MRRITGVLLWVEFLTLFVIIPMACYLEAIPLPVIPVLLLGTIYCVVVTLRDTSFPRTNLWRAREPLRKRGLAMLAVFAAGSAALGLVVWFWRPEWLFGLLRQRPEVWVLVVLLYPILSVYPQEFVYRAFFFHRYRGIFPTGSARVAASAVAFAYMHLVYDNWIAIALTLIGGFIFARTYQHTRSLFLVSLEHALYGLFIFTIGLGHLFYKGH